MFSFITLLIALVSSFVFGSSLCLAETSTQLPFPACADDIAKLCTKAEQAAGEGKALISCLRKNQAQLSDKCREEMERVSVASRQAASRAGGALGSFGGMTQLTPPIPLVSYEGRYSPDGPGLIENKLNFSTPVAMTEQATVSMSLAAGHLRFADPVHLSSGQTLPNDLYRAEIGAQTSLRLDGHKTFGTRISIGSTGDQVFQSIRDANFSLAMTYGFPGSASGDYWIALVYFANNSVIGDYIPIPGVIYVHHTEHFTGVFGFPVLSLQWTPVPLWAFSASVLGTTLVTEAAYGSVTAAQTFVQASFNQQRYILHDRLNDRDRLTFQERKVGLGYRRPLFASAFGEVQFGRAFGRSLYLGQKILQNDGGLADLDSSLFLNATFKFVF